MSDIEYSVITSDFIKSFDCIRATALKFGMLISGDKWITCFKYERIPKNNTGGIGSAVAE